MISEIRDSSWKSGKLVRCSLEEETLVKLANISLCTDLDSFVNPIGCNHSEDVICYYAYKRLVKVGGHQIIGLWRWQPLGGPQDRDVVYPAEWYCELCWASIRKKPNSDRELIAWRRQTEKWRKAINEHIR